MGHKFINQITGGEAIDDIYVVHDPVLRSTSNGSLYIAMFVADKTGQLNGRMWQATEQAYSTLPKPGFVHILGRCEIYQGSLQIIVNQFRLVDSKKVDISDYLPRTDKNIDEMFAEAKRIVGTIKNAQLKALINEFLADKALMEKFRVAPGGIRLHHNCLGGLLEHTLNMLKTAVAILPFYPNVNGDLVLTGIFLHDLGKTEELAYDVGFSYTDSGQLIGHIMKSFLMMHLKADALAAKQIAIEQTVIDSLGHIILSHHGEYEFGSPKLPATIEAFMVNYIDDLDAKLSQVTSAINDEVGDSNWTAWQSALGTRLYRKRIE